MTVYTTAGMIPGLVLAHVHEHSPTVPRHIVWDFIGQKLLSTAYMRPISFGNSDLQMWTLPGP